MAAGQLATDKGLLYVQVKDALRERIRTMEDEARLPARGDLSQEYGVTRTTIDRAISELIGEGLLVAKDGSGTYVVGESQAAERKGVDSWGVILPDIMQDTYPGILRGVEDAAEANRINVVICNTNNSIEKQTSYIEKLLESEVSGVVMVPAIRGSYDLEPFKRIQAKGIKLVFCNRGVPGIEAPIVASNNFYGGFLATSHLLKNGYRKVAYLSRPAYSVAIERYQGYMGALSEAGMDIDEGRVRFEESYDIERPGYLSARELLESKTGVDAIFCFNDVVARGAYEAAVDLGLRPGADVGLVGYDNTNVCGLFPVKLSSVLFKTYEIGSMAAKVLLEALSSEPPSPGAQHIFQPELVVRDSSRRSAEN